MKGAPPKLSYLKELLPLLSSSGATDLLIEYEDMFPYWGELQNISATTAYPMQVCCFTKSTPIIALEFYRRLLPSFKQQRKIISE